MILMLSLSPEELPVISVTCRTFYEGDISPDLQVLS